MHTPPALLTSLENHLVHQMYIFTLHTFFIHFFHSFFIHFYPPVVNYRSSTVNYVTVLNLFNSSAFKYT